MQVQCASMLALDNGTLLQLLSGAVSCIHTRQLIPLHGALRPVFTRACAFLSAETYLYLFI